MHPFENPDHHVFTINYSIEPTPISFMEEIFEWPVKKRECFNNFIVT